MKLKIALTALLAASAATAQAGTGLRADIHSGWDGRSVHQRTDVGTSGATTQISDDGVIYGGELGYDAAFAGFTLGAYAGIEGATTKRCSEVFAEVETCERSGRNLTLGVRAGVAVAPRIMLYAKSGYSNGQARVQLIDHATPANSLADHENMDGWHAGAGVQVNLFSNLYAKLEYVHTDYQDYTIEEGSATITGGINRDNVLFGVGLSF